MELTIQKRTITKKKVKNLRKENKIPAILYGKHMNQSIPISCDKNTFIKIYKQCGTSTPITLIGDGIKELALIQSVQIDPVYSRILHADFHAVKADEKVRVSVPILLVGHSPIEKLGDCKIQLVKDHIEVEALPQDLPHDIQIDIEKIQSINDVIFVKDINISEKVTILTDAEQPIVTVVSIEEEPATEEVVDIAGNAIAEQKEAEKKQEKEKE